MLTRGDSNPTSRERERESTFGGSAFWAPAHRNVSGMLSQARLTIEACLVDELDCARWCAEKGLVRPAPCPNDGSERRVVRYESTDGLRWYCEVCRKKTAVMSGSIFARCRLPVGRALMLIHRFAWGATYEDVKLACQLVPTDTELSDHTVADWYAYLRDRLVDLAADESAGKIGGPGRIVQIDEALIGRRKYNRGRVLPGTWVVGLIAEDGQLRLTVVTDRSGASLLDVVRKYVEPGSEIHSDGWRGYSGLKALGYAHRTVNHSVEFVAADGAHTQRIESQWRNIRRKFSRGGIRHEDIGFHLVEHVWRRQLRIDNKDPFLELLKILQCE